MGRRTAGTGDAEPATGDLDEERLRSTKRLADPRTMRALAHPLRLRLLSLLRTGGPASVSVLADGVNESVALVSYHLHQLADHGFIQESPELARDRRERWWKASHQRTTWSNLDFLDSPERRGAAGAFRREVLRLYAERLQQYLDEEPGWSDEWKEAADSSDFTIHLTAGELRSLWNELFGVLEKWVTHGETKPERSGAEMVQIIMHAFPRKIGA
jgi:DNA-binding transcriptional ArsR family regulator